LRGKHRKGRSTLVRVKEGEGRIKKGTEKTMFLQGTSQNTRLRLVPAKNKKSGRVVWANKNKKRGHKKGYSEKAGGTTKETSHSNLPGVPTIIPVKNGGDRVVGRSA